MPRTSVAPAFVHRESELMLATERLSQLKSGNSISEPVLFFHGVPMIGKSTLLRAIQRQAVQYRIPTAFIDFSAGYERLSGRGRLVRDILKQWQDSANIQPLQLITSQDDPDDAIKKIVSYVRQLRQNIPPIPVVLLLDTIEKIEREFFSWLQQYLLEPILDDNKTFIIFAARSEHMDLPLEMSWPVSRRARFIALRPFLPKETRDHYKALLRDKSPTQWHRKLINDPNWLTLGIPGLNEIALRQRFDTEEAGLRYIVENVIFKRVAQGTSTELQDLILTMSAFRKFDYRALSEAANHFWKEKYPDPSRRAGVDLARQMRDARLLEMCKDGYGYVVSPDLRRLLDNYQRYANKQRHFETHCFAHFWFQNEVAKGDFVSIADQIYHLAGVWFDLRQDEERNLHCPTGIPEAHGNRVEVLQEVIKIAIKNLDHASNSDLLINKVLNAFQYEEQEFMWFLSPEEMSALIDDCKKSLEQVAENTSHYSNV